MALEGVTFVPEDPELWAVALASALDSHAGPAPEWQDKKLWSYESIFQRQVIDLYARLANTTA